MLLVLKRFMEIVSLRLALGYLNGFPNAGGTC
jgi:hypothetical protein